MSMRATRKSGEDEAPGAPAWMVTFSDCMTLLLTFFVMLLSFSSWDQAALNRLLGAMHWKPTPSITDHRTKTDESFSEQPKRVVDRTEQGAEKRTSSRTEAIPGPHEGEPVVETDAYHEEKVLHIPARRLFLGKSSALTRDGEECLAKLAAFMRMVPCQVILGEVAPEDAGAEQAPDEEDGFGRPWVLLQYFTRRHGLAAERFHICPEQPWPRQRPATEESVQLVLLVRDITR